MKSQDHLLIVIIHVDKHTLNNNNNNNDNTTPEGEDRRKRFMSLFLFVKDLTLADTKKQQQLDQYLSVFVMFLLHV